MITDYSSLQTAVASFANRVGDTEFATQVPLFVQLAEAAISRDLRRRKVRATVTFNQETFTLPADCAELTSVRLVTGSPRQDLPFAMGTVEALSEARTNLSTPGRPSRGAVIDRQLVMVPTPDQAYTAEIVYLQGIVPLSTTPTNAVLTEAPDLYLYGALTQAAPYLERDERVEVWSGLFQSALDRLNAKREREELGASLRPARPPVAF